MLQPAVVAYQKAANFIRLVKPFVRVYGKRIGLLDAFQEVFALLSQYGSTPVGPVYVIPEVFLFTKFATLPADLRSVLVVPAVAIRQRVAILPGGPGNGILEFVYPKREFLIGGNDESVPCESPGYGWP